MRVLVTGGAGFVGSHVVDALVAGGHDVVVVDLLHPLAHHTKPDHLNDGAEYRFGDLADPEVAADAVAGVDAVCHQAAMVGLGVDFADAPDYVSHNDLATARLLAALHGRRFTGPIVLASSMVVYGEGGYRCGLHGPARPGERRTDDLSEGRFDPPCPACGGPLEAVPVTESAPVDPRNVYAATKLHQEHLVAAFGREHGAATVALRYHNVYGPRMPRDTPYAGVASIFRSALEAGRAPQVFEDGGQRRDFVHVRDVAVANVLALTADLDGHHALNVATGNPKSVLDMARALVAAFGPDAPAPEVVGGWRPGDVRHVFASPERARAVLGFEATVPFDVGMGEFASAALR
ncbi:MAG TPA: NAD-dependent epimerase/dehydratase family protein [Acidimicrobiia bacterium]|nr:NAD-dependent epimerase/dehydratase family protein [Acidimicrobiia bacterium]